MAKYMLYGDGIHVGRGATVGELSVDGLTLENHTGRACPKMRCLGRIERLTGCITEDEIVREEDGDRSGN